jgi:tetratricopeptide (TPR) repeat protein
MMGLALYAVGEEERASYELERSLTLSPHLFPLEMDVGIQRFRSAEWQGATERFQAVIGRNPHRADALCLLGSTCLEEGNLADAEKYLVRALEVNADYVEARKRLALVQHRKGKIDDALRTIRKALELHQDYADLHKIMGDLHMEARNMTAACVAYENALRINSDYSEAMQALVVALRRNGRGSIADQKLKEFLDRHPDDLGIRALLTMEKMRMEGV